VNDTSTSSRSSKVIIRRRSVVKAARTTKSPQSWKISVGSAAYAASASSRVTVTVSSTMVGGAATAGLATARLRTPATMESANLMAFMVPPSIRQRGSPPNPSARTQAGHTIPLVASYPPERPTIDGTCLTFAEFVYSGRGQRRLTSSHEIWKGVVLAVAAP
jgi:hypothetical protein